MKGLSWKQCICAVVVCFILSSLFAADEKTAPTPAVVRSKLGPYINPLGSDAQMSSVKWDLQELGRMLFYERRLSYDRKTSCNDCHDLSRYGANGAAVELLQKEGRIRRNVPGIYNATMLDIFYWDGRSEDLSKQTEISLLDKSEMGMREKSAVVDRLRSIDGYRGYFEKTFPGEKTPISFEHVVDALVAFEKGLLMPAPIDRFMEGDDSALDDEQRIGALLFYKHDCGSCHTGSLFGGQMVQLFGVHKPWPNQEDKGYYEVSGNPAHKMFFRVPSLRNVAETAPYFHDGSVSTLRSAIYAMARHEGGRPLTSGELTALEAFLRSLSGTIPQEYIQKPELP